MSEVQDLGWKIQCDERLTESQKDEISRYAQATARDVRARIVAALRKKADYFESELGEERGAIEFRLAAQYVEDGCPE